MDAKTIIEAMRVGVGVQAWLYAAAICALLRAGCVIWRAYSELR
jgi:hypothetical protein